MVTSAKRSDHDLCLLGPLKASVAGREVALGGPRQMAVLARLMVSPDQVVSMDQLIASVWDGDEPAQPHVTIRSYVSNLRRAIEPNRRRRSADSCLASSPPGYRLAVELTAIDWVRFQRLVDEARDRVVAGDCAAAVVAARHALSLWRGEPCSGLPTSEVFETHRLRLTALRQTAVELLYESLLHLGEHDAVAAEIEAAIVEDPLRERLTELGMLAFYRVGRQSEALALGRRLRDRLVDDLGIDPSPSIADMELRILNHDPALEPMPGSANPFSAIITGPVPPEFSATNGTPPDPAGPSAPVERDTWRPPAPGPAGFGRRPGPLVGRIDVRDRLAEMAVPLGEGRMAAVAVVGEQGSGKTTLVRDAVRRLTEAGDRVVWAHSVSDSSAPLWPWAQVVVGLVDGEDGPDRDLTAGLGALRGLGQSVADLLDEDGPGEVPTTEIILAVSSLLARCARRGPIVVVLEDLHWADRSTVTVLEYAISTLVEAPVALVATWREPEHQDGALATGLRSLSRLPDLSRIDLAPFSTSEVAELAASLGRPLSPDHIASVQRRTDGNPLFVDELLAEPTADAVAGPPSPNLRALVTDRVARVHDLAPSVMRAAALFRAPFTAEDLRALHEDGATAVEPVLVAGVRGRLLDEVDPALGTYRFRHPIVAEVLAADTLSGELRSSHRIIGQQLLTTDEAEASYHLAWSPDPADRVLAARIALDLFHRGSRNVELAELDSRIRNGLTAAEVLGRADPGAERDGLVSDALGFLSWRARVEDRPDDWVDNAWRSLRAAVNEVQAGGSADDDHWSPPPVTLAPLRAAGRDQPGDRPIDRLERAVLNLIGWPAIPAGPGDPADFMVGPGPVADELADAIEVLAPDSPAAAAARIHLLAVGVPSRTGSPARVKAMRDAQRILVGARKRRGGPELAPVLATFVARFGSGLDPEEAETLLDDLEERRPGVATELLWSRYGYPALIAAGRTDAALRRAESALTAAESTGDPLLRAEARLLWTRHLLWTGQLDGAERSIAETADDLASLDLAEPLPLLRQRRILRSLRGQSGDAPTTDGAGLSRPSAMVPGADRASPAELAFRLAHLGQRERASEHISRLAEPERIEGIDVAELALLGAAAHLIGHQPAARFFHQELVGGDDTLIVRHDGSAILGPVELWASFAANGAGKRREARRLLDAALDAIRRHGGGIPVQMLYPDGSANDLPIESQPNLKSARAH